MGREPHGDAGWEPVAAVGAMEAEVLRAALETADIPVVSRGETVGTIYALTATELGQVVLLVPADRLEEARALLQGSTAINFPEGD
ncbi:MAG TPA: DUF2007 domain-containing protein [Candidatus Dormibacteraeota bacterium]|nr:DUF2007 domain-containing protein [Candidatus Dormibacteraeota bacterium]